ncbi:MAG: hypothetical protein LBV51_03605, partial [Acholeplasmatales bacterium]|nr:hypothetical protein [Acholeplasmatales bacterium]
KVLFDKFDFTQGNLLLYYFNTSVFYSWKDFIFHDLEILDHNVTINFHNNSVSDIDLYAITQNVFILNVPKEIDNSYSFDWKAFS